MVDNTALARKEKDDDDRGKEKEIEEAFLKEEREALQKEHADMMTTKRIVDKMMFARPEDVNGVICELLANYKGKELSLSIEG